MTITVPPVVLWGKERASPRANQNPEYIEIMRTAARWNLALDPSWREGENR
jgi:hypothetical protein